MEMGLKDKVVIVTGSGRGIGQEIAMKFARQQAKIAVVDRKKERAVESAKMVEHAGGKASALGTDVTNFNDVQIMLDKTLEAFGDIHVLVNNAGWSVLKPFFECPVELWDGLIDLNLKACMNCSRVVGEVLIKKGNGKIVNIASDAGRVGSADEAVSAAAKGGVIAFTKSMALSLASYHINVNCISPGPTDTPMVRKGIAMSEKIAEEMERRREAIPFKRWAKPEEIADAVLFLASDAANYITGQVLSVSGGLTMVD